VLLLGSLQPFHFLHPHTLLTFLFPGARAEWASCVARPIQEEGGSGHRTVCTHVVPRLL
jgi:hypothetical protein